MTISYYPKRGSEIFAFDTFADLPDPPIDFTFATTLDTDNLYVWDADSSTWKVIAGPNTTFGGITQLFGDVTAMGPGVAAATIEDEAVTLAKIANAAASSKLLGSSDTGAGSSYVEITLGTNLSISGTTLNAMGGGGDVTGPASSVDNAIARFDSTTGKLLQNSGATIDDSGNITATNLSGTNTGNQTITLTGDVTGSGTGSFAATLATVNANVGTFGSATQVAQVTLNGKGLATAASNVTVTPAASSITGGAALTKTDDTNVTLTLGGTPASALLAAASITAGWTGTLSGTRGGTGVNNGASTITLGGSLTHSGAFTQQFTATGNTSITLPTTGTLATLAGTESLTNKTLNNTNALTLRDDRFTLQDNGDNTKQAVFELSGITTATTRTLTVPNASTTIAGTDATQTLTNKTLDNSNTFTIRDDRLTLQDNADTTKQAVLQLSGITTATTRTYTAPNANGTLVLSVNSNAPDSAGNVTIAGGGDVVGDDVSTTVQNIVAYSTTGGKNITELTGTQGDVLYHNGTSWVKLGAGTSGHFLRTNGVGANPVWAAAGSGSGPSLGLVEMVRLGATL